VSFSSGEAATPQRPVGREQSGHNQRPPCSNAAKLARANNSSSVVVAHNMARARRLRGLTQAQVAEHLTRYTEKTWTQVAVAQAERGVTGARMRSFTINELVALARVFDTSVLFLLAPPSDRPDVEIALPGDRDLDLDRGDISDLLFGTEDSLKPASQPFEPWAQLATMAPPDPGSVDTNPLDKQTHQMGTRCWNGLIQGMIDRHLNDEPRQPPIAELLAVSDPLKSSISPIVVLRGVSGAAVTVESVGRSEVAENVAVLAVTLACAVVVAMAHQPALGRSMLLVVLVGVAGVLALIDLRERRLPNAIVYPLFVAVAGAVVVAGVVSGELGRAALAVAAGVGAGVGLGFGARAMSLGMGDVKLAASVAVVLGWFGLVPAGVLGLWGLRSRALDPDWLVPMGPALAAGLVVGLVAAGVGL